MKSMKCFMYSFVIATFLHSAWIGTVLAHEFETGHIERSIDVVVRDRKAEVTYAIGLSDATIVDWLVDEQLINAVEEARFRKRIAEFEKEAESEKLDEGKPKLEQDLEMQKLSSAEGQIASTKSDSVKVTQTSDDSQEPLGFQSELLTLLREKLSGPICENLELNCDGKPLFKSEVVASNSARHHVSMEIVFSVDLPDAEKIKLSIVDRNFLDSKDLLKSDKSEVGEKTVSKNGDQNASGQEFRYLGSIRLACRVKGNSVQLNSNVAPILARAKSTDVGPLNLEQRLEAATIQTMIAVPNSSKR